MDEIGRKMREAKEKKEMLGLVRVILELSEKLKLVKVELRKGRVVEAAEVVKDLKVALRIRENGGKEEEEEEREPVVYGLLRKEWTECFEEVR